MKKKNLKNLKLSKKSISSLSFEKVKGAGDFFTQGPSCFCKTAGANNLTNGNCILCQIL